MSPTRRAERRVGRRGLPALGLLAACDAPFQIFSTASDEAARVTRLTWFLLALAAAVFIVVMGILAWAVRRNRRREPDAIDLTERGTAWIIAGGAIGPALILGVIWLVAVGAIGRFPPPNGDLTVRVTARQWWWRVDYQFPDPTRRFPTANEIHVPVGRPVRVVLVSRDVIHSFWVPRLQGKLDVIPGDTTEIRLLARQPGTYWGECAEFCGVEHTKMRLVVVAESADEFERWAAREAADAAMPADSTLGRGRELFETQSCALCHAVRGTTALGQVAPDLTHLGSRRSIAAGTLPNTLGNLEAWIANAQSIKPGAKMPTLTGLTGRELLTLARYVESLK